MLANLPTALAMLFVSEGDYSNDKHDPGGATKRGVIQVEYNAYRRRQGQPTQPVRLISDDEIKDIYKHQYWDMVHADELPAGMDYMIFDDAVNTGVRQAVRNVQRTLNTMGYKLAVDGSLGLITMTALHDVDPVKFINKYDDQRMWFYRNIPGWRWFSGGWTHRIYGQPGDPGVLKNALSFIPEHVAAVAAAVASGVVITPKRSPWEFVKTAFKAIVSKDALMSLLPQAKQVP